MQLSKRSSIISLSNRCYLYLMFVVLVLFSFYFWYLWIVVIVLFIKLRRFLSILLLSAIVFLVMVGQFLINDVPFMISGEVIIIDKEKVDSYYSYTVNHKMKNYIFTSNQNYELGTTIVIKGTVERYRQSTIPGGFNTKTYYLGQGIYGRLRSVQIISSNADQFYTFIYQLIDWENPFILLIKDKKIIDVSVYSFLFTLSSVHLSLLINLLRKLMYYLDIKNTKKQQIIYRVLLILYVIGGSVIILRHAIINLLTNVSKTHKWTLSKFDIECATLTIMIIFIPNIVFNQTFILISLFVLFNQLKVIDNNVSDIVLVPLILIPFMLSWNHEINLITFIIVPIILFVAKLTFVPTIFLLILFPFSPLIPELENILNQLIGLFNHRIGIIYLPTLPWYGIIIYLLILVWIYASKQSLTFYKRITCLTFIFIIGFLVTLRPRADEVIFLDIGQGDSAVIFKNQKTIVVDAFGDIKSYLTYRYVSVIDYLIITHNDLDHMMEANDLIEKFEVKHLVLSGYLDYQLMHPNIIHIDEENLPVLDHIGLEFLAPTRFYTSKNDCSIVFKINVNEMDYLFTGDISSLVEHELVLIYGESLDVDVLKVAHHGSSTSSSLLWLQTTTPTYAIISSARYNIYGHPDQNIINRYQSLGIYIYLTSENGSILFGENEVIMFS